MCASLFLVSFAVLQVASSRAQAEGVAPVGHANASVEVWTSGEGGYHTYRIPSVVCTPSNVLVAFAEARKHGSGDSGDIDLVCKRSLDGGRSWDEQRVLWDDGNHVCGNPCAVVDRSTGDIVLLLTRNLGGDAEHEIIAGTSEGTRTVWLMRSSDAGVTWTKPREITDTAKRKTWTWYATGPGVGIQLQRGEHAGRLVIPCDHIERESKRYYSHVLLSDDGGANWRIGGRSQRDKLNECQAAELATGDVVVNMRNYDRAKRRRAVMTSADSGVTFGNVRWDEALPEPICQAGLIAVHRGSGSDAKARLYFSNCASEDRRVAMTLRASDDDGASWRALGEVSDSPGTLLFAGPSAYSCLVELETDEDAVQIGCLYEAGVRTPYEAIRFEVRGDRPL